MPNKFLTPSGLNTQFIWGDLTFSDYIATMQQLISKTRLDIDLTNANKIITANSPYECSPKIHSKKAGILLIHGLYESPFALKDFDASLSRQGFLVRSILLPGHGTVPGDLLHIHYADWIKAVNYGVKTLAQEVENVYLLGFSLGASLALREAYANPLIKGLVLIAPAFKIIRKFVSLASLYRLYGWMHETFNWYHIHPQRSYAKYESYPVNAAVQICQLTKTLRTLCNQPLSMPLFVVLTEDDETICYKSALKFFQQQLHPDSKLVLYSNQLYEFADSRITTRASARPEEGITNFSHICLAIAPHNPHFGKTGDYPRSNRSTLLGATIREDGPDRNGIQRLRYNPDFDWMKDSIIEFLDMV